MQFQRIVAVNPEAVSNPASVPVVRGGSVRVTTRLTGEGAERAEVEVADDGRGIAEEDLERIFEPFYTTKAPGHGTGLGLAIAHGIAREHGGDIRIESAPGQGTRAVLSIPVHRMDPRLLHQVPGRRET